MRVRTIVLLSGVIAGATAPACGQSTESTATQQQPIFRTSDAVILGAAVAGSTLLMKYDERISAWKGLAPLRDNPPVRNTLDAAAFLGGPGSLAIEAAIFGAGRIGNNKVLANDGEIAFEATVASSVVTYLLKRTIGRARPGLDSTHADDFGFGRGFTSGNNYQSFPSGHTTAAFAFATAITARLAERNSSSVNWAAPALFSLATLTAIQRVTRHAHWASDCLMGAAIGTVGGLAAARWHERHP